MDWNYGTTEQYESNNRDTFQWTEFRKVRSAVTTQWQPVQEYLNTYSID